MAIAFSVPSGGGALQGIFPALVILLGLILWSESSQTIHFLPASHASSDRVRLVTTIAREQDRVLSDFESHLDTSVPKVIDDHEMSRWIVNQWFRYRSPLRVSRSLDESGFKSTHIKRWKKDLSDWSDQEDQVDHISSAELLNWGRHRIFQAQGYQRSGETLEASLFHIWGISLLSKYIERSPSSDSMPEALYLLGVSYLALRDAFPSRVRSDRMLNLCSELYPDTVWGREASRLWKEEMTHDL